MIYLYKPLLYKQQEHYTSPDRLEVQALYIIIQDSCTLLIHSNRNTIYPEQSNNNYPTNTEPL